MWNFNIGRCFGLMFQTLPFIALRTAVYFGCSLLLILGWLGGPALGAYLAPESMWELGAWMGFGIGASVTATIVYFIREYFLYLVKAGHIAVLVELMEGRPLPNGKGQFAYAKNIVAERFVEASAFFVLDQVVTGVLGVINKVLLGLGSIIPGMDGAMAFVGSILRLSLTFADEVILALSFRTRSTDIWRTSRDGVVLYAQNYKNILKNAFFLAILNYALLFAFFLMAWVPSRWIAGLMPGAGSAVVVFLVAVLFVYSLKKALIEPLLMTALMQVYFRAIEGQVPNPAWTQKLEGVSQKFAEMKQKFVGPGAEQAAVPAPPTAASAGQWPAQSPQPAQPVHWSQDVHNAQPGQHQQPAPYQQAAQYPQAAYQQAAPYPQAAHEPVAQYQQPAPYQQAAPYPQAAHEPVVQYQQPAPYQQAAPYPQAAYQQAPQYPQPAPYQQASQTPQRVPYQAPAGQPAHLPQGSTTLPMGMVNGNR